MMNSRALKPTAFLLATASFFVWWASISYGQHLVPGGPEKQGSPPPTPSIETVLEQIVTLRFEQTPLSEFVDYLRQLTRANIVIDRPSIEEEQLTVDEPITIDVENVPLSVALDLALLPVGFDYIIQGPVLVITTQTQALETMYTRSYPVADFVAASKQRTLDDLLERAGVVPGRLQGKQETEEAIWATPPGMGGMAGGGGYSMGSGTRPRKSFGNTAMGGRRFLPNYRFVQFGGGVGGAFGPMLEQQGAGAQPGFLPPPPGALDALIETIRSSVTPEAWMDQGGIATITAYGTTLVVRHNRRGHKEVEAFLQDLRRSLPLDRPVVVELTWELCDAQRTFEIRNVPSSQGSAADVGARGAAVVMRTASLPIQANGAKEVARFATVMLPGQTIGVVGGRAHAVLAEAVPVVAENVESKQLVVKEALDGLKAQVGVSATDKKDQFLLELEFHLTFRYEPSSSAPDGPDTYRAGTASTSIVVPLSADGRKVPIALLPIDRDTGAHVLVSARLR